MKIEIVENDFALTTQGSLEVPEISIRYDLNKELNHLNHLALAALIDGRFAGYKIGYERTSDTFYSWIGGTVPVFRRNGVGQALLEYQENWAASRGYKRIEVKSMNKYPGMLHFLIKNSYLIYGIESGDKYDEAKILFSKQLNEIQDQPLQDNAASRRA